MDTRLSVSRGRLDGRGGRRVFAAVDQPGQAVGLGEPGLERVERGDAGDPASLVGQGVDLAAQAAESQADPVPIGAPLPSTRDRRPSVRVGKAPRRSSVLR